MSSTRWPGLQRELGREVTLLGKLGLVEVGDAVFPIGAGVLQVGVEEERIEPAIEVVVRMDVLLRDGSSVFICRKRRVARRQPPTAIAGHGGSALPRVVGRSPSGSRRSTPPRRSARPSANSSPSLRSGSRTTAASASALVKRTRTGPWPSVAEGVDLALGVDDLQRSLADGLRSDMISAWNSSGVRPRQSQSFPSHEQPAGDCVAPADDNPDSGAASTLAAALRILAVSSVSAVLRRLPRRPLRPRPQPASSSASPAPASA